MSSLIKRTTSFLERFTLEHCTDYCSPNALIYFSHSESKFHQSNWNVTRSKSTRPLQEGRGVSIKKNALSVMKNASLNLSAMYLNVHLNRVLVQRNETFVMLMRLRAIMRKNY
uniref:AlNc14C96G5868 protein n=1 Tax=Albugo laibachii Nc14 TaxID=890382 RepID=F0WGZ3_9STRA|nr:AlNc14C96G5868 [Albugo laibachii Nc14]|eukprot:CCA20508.1 AlNc14C96G5868 [Albugo laibachii Nc14]